MHGNLQLTHKDNYTRYGESLDLDLVGNPDLAAGGAATLSALQFFKLGNINAAVDAGGFREAQRAPFTAPLPRSRS